MRILLVHQAWPPGGGGSALYTRALARGLAARHEVTVLCGASQPERAEGEVSERDVDGIRLVTLNRLRSAGFESYRDPGVVEAVKPLLDEVHPELVHVGSLAGLSTGLVFEARRRRASVVVTLHDFWPFCALGQLLDLELRVCPGPTPTRCLGCVGEQVSIRAPAARRLGAALRPLAPLGRLAARASSQAAGRIETRLAEMRALLQAADCVIAPSRFLRDRVTALGAAGVIHLPYGLEQLPPVAPASASGERLRFGFLGSAIPSKGVHVLASAFRSLDDPRAALHVHGDFPPYHGDTRYRERVRDLLGESNAVLHGAYSPEQVAQVLTGIDVVVVPSLWEENAPLVVQEAFRAKRPLIVSDHGGLAELVREGVDGLRVPPGDATALAAAMRRLLDDAALRSRLGTSPPHVPDMDDHMAALDAVYAEARQRRRRRPGRVGVVIPDRGHPEEAAAAARSALDPELDVRVLIVEDGPCERGAAAGPWEVMTLPRRCGFAGAVNAGVARLREAGCDRILLLNSDARLERGALRQLAEALEDEALGAVGPLVLRERDGRVESRGVRLDLDWGRHRLLGHGERPEPRAGLAPAAALSGAALMLRVSAFDRIGSFDEAYFHGFEDVDWCLRLGRSGLGLAVVLHARVHHAGGRTLGAEMPERLHYAARNHVRAVERLAPRHGVARWLRRGSIAGLGLAHALRQGAVPRGVALRAVLAGTRDAWRGASGPLKEK